MMTRSMNRPESPKSRYSGIGSQPPRLQDGSVCKRQPLSPTQRSVKMLSSQKPTLQECMAQLKSLLPKIGDEEEQISELALVERTINYIAYLESLLTTKQDETVQSTVEMFRKMAV